MFKKTWMSLPFLFQPSKQTHIQRLPTCARAAQASPGLFFWFNWCFVFPIISPLAQREIFFFIHSASQVHDKGSPWYTLCLPSTHHSQTLDWLNYSLGGYTLLERKTLSSAILPLVFLNWKLKSWLYLSLAGMKRDVFVMLWATITSILNKILSTTQQPRQAGVKANPVAGDPVQPRLCTLPNKS